MNMKKTAKVALTATLATTAFVAASPAQAASVTPKEAVATAQIEANKLVPFYTLEAGEFEVTAAFTAQYNKATAAINAAEKLAGQASDRQWFDNQLNYAKELRLRAARIIDANKHVAALAEAQANFDKFLGEEITTETVEAYNALSAEIRAAERAVYRIYGEENREIAGKEIIRPAKMDREQLIWEVTAFNLLGEIEEDVAAKNAAAAADKLALLDRVNARAVAIKEAGKKLYGPDAYPTYAKVVAQLEAKETAVEAKYQALLAPSVTSVETINAKKIEVKFNKEVSEAQAENISNYTIVGVNGFVTATLQEDGKTVVLSSNTAIPNGTTFVVTVAEIATKADANAKTAKFTKTVSFSDTVRPSFANVTYPKPGVAELHFSEELSTEGNVVVYDGLVENQSVTKTLSGNKIVLGSLQLNKEYRVVITGAKDQSGNLISAPVELTVKSAVSDTTKPVVESVSSQGLDTVKVQFSEAIQATNGVFASIDVNGVAASGTLSQSFDSKTNVLTVSGITGIANGDVKSITVKGFSDLANNAGNSLTKVIAFSTSAPALQSTQVVQEGSKTFAVLTFDKAVVSSDSTVAASYVNAENVYKTTTLPVTYDSNKKQVKLEVTGKEAGAYTVSFAAGKISDGVTSNTKPLTVNFNVGSSVDSSVPEVANVFMPGQNLDANTVVPAGTVYVKYSKSMAASALNADNYTVDGSTVFTNPIFVGDKTLVKLTIKDSSISVSGDRNFAISSAVKGENNVALKAYAAVKTFTENVKPVLTSAALVDDMTIELTFSELLGSNGFTTATNDFEVLVGGTKNAVTAVTEGTVGDNKVRVTLTNKITADQLANSAITVKTLDTADITDKAGNKLTANTTVSVAK